MYCILIPENLRSQNSIILEHLCRVHKIKHTATRIFVVCFIQAHSKGDGGANYVKTSQHQSETLQIRVSKFACEHNTDAKIRVSDDPSSATCIGYPRL